MINPYFTEYHFGTGAPRIALIAAMHGDELNGPKILHALQKQEKHFTRPVLGIIANPRAMQKKKRFIESDLNRSFVKHRPKTYEDRLARKLKKRLSTIDIVIDIHATSSNINALVITTTLNSQVRALLLHLPSRIKKIALAPKHIFGGNELISNISLGISLEYGPHKSGKDFRKALQDIQHILTQLGALPSTKKLTPSLKRSFTLYQMTGSAKIPKSFVPQKKFREFSLIKKGALLGRAQKKAIRAKKSFYPLFLGKGAYQETFCITAKKSTLKI